MVAVVARAAVPPALLEMLGMMRRSPGWRRRPEVEAIRILAEMAAMARRARPLGLALQALRGTLPPVVAAAVAAAPVSSRLLPVLCSGIRSLRSRLYRFAASVPVRTFTNMGATVIQLTAGEPA